VKQKYPGTFHAMIAAFVLLLVMICISLLVILATPLKADSSINSPLTIFVINQKGNTV